MLLGDTLVRFLSQLFIRMGMSDDYKRGRSVRAQAELEWSWHAMRVRVFHIHQINFYFNIIKRDLVFNNTLYNKEISILFS